MAGTGKSTISQTIATSLAQEARLAASFFFKRGESDQGTMAKFFPTIATNLTRRGHIIAHYIKCAIKNKPDIFRKAIAEQFNKLFLQPLSILQKREPIVVIIDALDE
jgi:adenylylsulfate kinase-like enzyme